MKNNVVTLLLVALFFCTNCTLVAGNTFGRRRPAEEKHQKIARAYRAAVYGPVEELEDLLNRGIKVEEIKNNRGSTALGAAVYGWQPEGVRCLLEHGASVTEECFAEQNSLQIALDGIDGNRSDEILCELLRYHPAREQLFDDEWVQRLVHRDSSQVKILFDAIDHIENNRQNGTAAQVVLADQLPAPVITMVQSYLSNRQETAEEKAQTVGLLARAQAH